MRIFHRGGVLDLESGRGLLLGGLGLERRGDVGRGA